MPKIDQFRSALFEDMGDFMAISEKLGGGDESIRP